MNKIQPKTFVRKNLEVLEVLFWKNKVLVFLVYSSLFLNLLIWGVLFWFFKNAGEYNLIIHYNVYLGVDGILINDEPQSWFNLFLPAAGGFLFWLISVWLSVFLIFQLDRFDNNKSALSSFISNRSISFVSVRILLISAWMLQLVLLVYIISLWVINY